MMAKGNPGKQPTVEEIKAKVADVEKTLVQPVMGRVEKILFEIKDTIQKALNNKVPFPELAKRLSEQVGFDVNPQTLSKFCRKHGLHVKKLEKKPTNTTPTDKKKKKQ